MFSQADRRDHSGHDGGLPRVVKPLAVFLLATFAFTFSLLHVDIAPGIVILIGPLFFMLAYRLWGWKVALPVAVLCLAPSYFWLGHHFVLVNGLLQLAFLSLCCLVKHASVLMRIALYHATVGLLVGPLMIWAGYDYNWLVAPLVWPKVIINDLVMAATADLILLFVAARPDGWLIGWRRGKALTDITRSGSSFVIILMTFGLFVAETAYVDRQIGDNDNHVRHAVAESLLRTPLATGRRLLNPGEGLPQVLLADQPAGIRDPAFMRSHGCSFLATHAETEAGNYRIDRRLQTCVTGSLQTEHGLVHYAYAPRALIIGIYWQMYRDMMPALVMLAFIIVLRRYLVRLVTHALTAWNRALNGFGTPGLAVPDDDVLAEFAQPIESFVRKNNQFVAMQDSQQHVRETIIQMKKSINLRLLADVSYDAESGQLSFINLDPDAGAIQQQVMVHPVDQAALDAAMNENEALIEFRFAESDNGFDNGPDADDWHLLITRSLTGPGKWSFGAIKRLTGPHVGHDDLTHRARLVEMGSMASAISHELKQPLFTIALAAENGAWQLAASSDGLAGKAVIKFRKIGEQVVRARDIIDRMARYARSDSKTLEAFNLFEAVQSATSFMRPVFVQAGISVHVHDHTSSAPVVRMARIGLEQIVVNALQNSADAIQQAREAGQAAGDIKVTLDDGADDMLVLTISDDGVGLSDKAAENKFMPFYTTKPSGKGTGLGLYVCRQIADEAGGQITLSRGAEAGAVFVFAVPRHHPLAATDESATRA